MPSPPGPLLHDRYLPQRQLGEGGFATTWLAQDQNTGDACVLKLLHLKQVPDWKALEMFEREVAVLRHLNHPRIPGLRDAFQLQTPEGLQLGLVQDFVDGKSLQQWVEQGRSFQEREAIAIGLQLCELLSYLHGFSPPVLHRDIKPSNVLLDAQGQVFLVDFDAVSRSLSPSSGGAMTLVGTVGYMPLEQLEGRATPASDLYGLGATLVFLLSGQNPAELPKYQLQPDLQVLTQISEDLRALLNPLLATDASKRPQQAEAVRQQLLWLQSDAARPRRQPGKRSHVWRWVGALSLGAALLWWQPWRPEVLPVSDPGTATDAASENRFGPAGLPPWESLKLGVRAMAQDGETVWLADYGQLCSGQPAQAELDCASLQTRFKGHFMVKELAARDGLLVALGSDGRLMRLHKGQVQPLPHSLGEKIKALTLWQDQLLVAREHEIWGGPRSGNRLQLLHRLPGKITLLHTDADGRLWAATGHQLYEITPTGFRKRWQGPRSFDDQIQALSGQGDQLWLATRTGLLQYRLSRSESQQPLQQKQVTALAPGLNGQLWAASDAIAASGLYRLDQGKTALLGWRHGLNANRFTQLFSAGGWLWALSSERELLRAPLQQLGTLPPAPPLLAHSRFDSFCSAAESLQPANGQSLALDRQTDKLRVFVQGQQVCPYGQAYRRGDGQLITYAGQDGVLRWRGGRFERLGKPTAALSVAKLLLDQQDRVWLSHSYPHTLFRYEAGRWQAGRRPEDPPLGFAPNLLATPSGQLWLSSANGEKLPLSRWQQSRWQPLEGAGRQKAYQAAVLLPLAEGSLAVGTPEGLALLSADGSSTRWLDALPYARIKALSEDGRGRLWVAYDGYSGGRGLSAVQLSSGEIRHLTSRQGLVEDQFQHLAHDNTGRLWTEGASGTVSVYASETLWQAAQSP